MPLGTSLEDYLGTRALFPYQTGDSGLINAITHWDPQHLDDDHSCDATSSHMSREWTEHQTRLSFKLFIITSFSGWSL